MRRLIAILVLALSLVLLAAPATAEPTPPAGEKDATANPLDMARSQLQGLDLSQVQGLLNEIDRQVGEFLPDLSLDRVLKDLSQGKLALDWRQWLDGAGRYLFRELLVGSKLLGQLLILAVICALLKNLQAAFAGGAASKLAHAVTYLALLTIAVGSFTLAVNTARGAVNDMVTFFQALLPVLLTMLAAVGGVATAGLIHPFTVVTIGVLSTLTSNVVFPLIYMGAVLGVVNEVSDRFQVSRLAGFLKQVALVLLGAFLTIFTGTLALQGMAGSVADSLSLRTAKFLMGSFVPIVGKMLSDAVELVAGASLLLKNAISLVGVLGILALALFPALKLLCLAVVYRLAAALVQPMGDSQIAAALDNIGSSLLMVFAALVGVGLMFFFAMGILVGLGNTAVMLR